VAGRRRFLAVLTMTALPACSSSPNPALYTIQPVTGAVRGSAPRVIQLRPIGLARYLDRQQIVRSAEGYRLDIATNDWWGEPLGTMLTRVLAEELSQRLAGSTVLNEDGAITADPDLTVEVNIRRLDASRAGDIVLAAQFAINRRNPRRALVTRAVDLSVPYAGADMNSFVAAASVAIGRLADAIADGMRA
jgi:uncharacterized protein